MNKAHEETESSPFAPVQVLETITMKTTHREFAYDRKSSIGRLDKGLDEVAAKGWTVVSMKDDWKTIFPPEKK